MFTKYDQCIFCGSKNLKKISVKTATNFYVDAIVSDLKISQKKIGKIKVYQCNVCNILQNNPWFNEQHIQRIYSNIYGQHNLGWKNILNFFNLKTQSIHSNLFNLLQKNMKIKSYAEFNSGSTGLFFDFFNKEYKDKENFKKKLFFNTLNYLNSRQVAGKTKKKIEASKKKTKEYFNKIELIKKKNLRYKVAEKYLFIDNSPMFWSVNDNYKSVNSRSFVSEIFDLKILNIYDQKNQIRKLKKKISLFGIFHTLDHTLKPKQVLNFALDNSDHVIVYCHIDDQVTKQHLFSLTKEFLSYLNKQKINCLDISEKINHSKKNPIMYFLCSKKKIKLKI